MNKNKEILNNENKDTIKFKKTQEALKTIEEYDIDNLSKGTGRIILSVLFITLLVLIDDFITLPSIILVISEFIFVILIAISLISTMRKELDYVKAWDYIKNTYQYNAEKIEEVEDQELDTCLEKAYDFIESK